MCTASNRRYLLPMRRIRELTGATALDVGLVLFVTAVTEWAVFETHEHVSTPIYGPRWLTCRYRC